jgi:hypothetical protein
LIVYDIDRLTRDNRHLEDAIEVVQNFGRPMEPARRPKRGADHHLAIDASPRPMPGKIPQSP